MRTQLYRLFHDVWLPIAELQPQPGAASGRSIVARLEALPPRERQILLLTALEGFPIDAAAGVMRIQMDEATSLLQRAWAEVNQQLATTVLVIEVESVIAIDIAGIVREFGHPVIGIAGSEREAVAVARAEKPGLVLADINLAPAAPASTRSEDPRIDGGAGDLRHRLPERLLTGHRPEPTYLFTKPFEPDTLKATISQALANSQSGTMERKSA